MLRFLNCGEITYYKGREIQTDFLTQRIRSAIPDTVLICEHPPTLTEGIRSVDSQLLVPKSELSKVEIVRTNRGGEWTAHEPGQLVIYPVIDLKARRLSAKCFVDVLLNTICSTLAVLNITARNSSKPAGVFIGDRKIASIGLKISQGVTNHGVSLNVSNSLELFKLIVPCGLTDTEMTSVSKELGRTVETSSIIPIIEEKFRDNFGD